MGMLLTYHRKAAADAAAEQVDTTPAEGWDALTDEQVAEAYATNVGGNATSRKGQTKALRKLDADAAAEDTTEDDGDGEQPDPENPGSDPADEPAQPDPENTPGE